MRTLRAPPTTSMSQESMLPPWSTTTSRISCRLLGSFCSSNLVDLDSLGARFPPAFILLRFSGLPVWGSCLAILLALSPSPLCCLILLLDDSAHDASNVSRSSDGIINSGSGDLVALRACRRGVVFGGGDSEEAELREGVSSSPSTTQDSPS